MVKNRILVVGDHPDQLEMVSHTLRQCGYLISTADEGRKGFDIAQLESPDVVICDVSMPRVNGIEMCRLIRKHPELGAIPFLLVSDNSKDSECLIEGLRAGADDYLEAPYDPTRLITKVTQLIERKRTEEALRESQTRLAGIVDSAMDAIITVDSEQRILLFNAAAEKMFRCPTSEAIGQPLDRFIPDRFRTIHLSHIRAFGQTGITTRAMASARAVYGLRADGEEFPLEASISQVEAGGQKLYTVIMRDITERKRAEETLRRSQEQLAGVIGSAMDAIITVDATQRIILFNGAAERMFRVPADEVVGQLLDRLIPIRFRATHQMHIQDFGRTNVTKRTMGSLGAIFGLRSDGEEFPIGSLDLTARIGRAAVLYSHLT